MRFRLSIYVVAVILVVFYWIFWLRPARVSDRGPEAPSSKVPQAAFPANPSFAPILQQRNPEKAKQAQEAFDKRMAALNRPIDFYGQTVDQDGNALPGVQIKMDVPHYLPLSLDGEVIHVDRTSDANGLFDIHDANVTGDAVDIESMSKEGYTLEPCHRGLGPIGGALGNPVVFRLWRNDIKEPLITGQKSFPIEPNGMPYVIDFGKGTISESGNGDLSVWIEYDTQTARGQLSDWLSELSVPGGGLLLESNLSSAMYVAPTNGYTPVFQYNQQIKGGQRGSTGEKRFYIMLKNGQEYGRITIGLYAPYNRQIPGMIRISYAINPTGSHVLR